MKLYYDNKQTKNKTKQKIFKKNYTFNSKKIKIKTIDKNSYK